MGLMELEYRNKSLTDWVVMFSEIYGEPNKNLPDKDIWLHVVEEVAELAEDLRKEQIKPRNNRKGESVGVLVNIADTFAWLAAFASRYDSLEKLVWHKYPNICPYCFAHRDCLCISQETSVQIEEREKKLELYRQDKTSYPLTLFDWQKMFDRIYGNINRNKSIAQVGFHLMEEIGEVAKGIRLGKKGYVKEELADVFAWTVGLTIKSADLTGENYRLDDIIWGRYPDTCPHCQSKPCIE